MPQLYEDLTDFDGRLHEAIIRATDLEQIVRLNVRIALIAERTAIYNMRALKRMCARLDIDLSDIPEPRSIPTSLPTAG